MNKKLKQLIKEQPEIFETSGVSQRIETISFIKLAAAVKRSELFDELYLTLYASHREPPSVTEGDMRASLWSKKPKLYSGCPVVPFNDDNQKYLENKGICLFGAHHLSESEDEMILRGLGVLNVDPEIADVSKVIDDMTYTNQTRLYVVKNGGK